MNKYSNIDLQKMRLYNNGLIDKFLNESICIESLIGIQCQYQTYAMISIYMRNKNGCDIFNNENLIKSWGQRTTLHIYHKSDYNLISDLYCELDNWVYKYAKKLGINYNEYLNKIISFFENNTIPISKSDIKSIIPEYKSKEIMEWSGLLILATYHKILYGIVNKEDKKIYVKNDINYSNKQIYDFIYRYFKYYGPATKKDFLHWSGLKYKDIKKELDDYIKCSKYLNINNEKYYYVSLPNLEKVNFNYPIILGKFDPLLISYNNKEWILNGYDKSLIWKAAGQVEGVILNEKGLCGTWHYKLKENKVFFEIKELNDLQKKLKKQLEEKFTKLGAKIFHKKITVIYQEVNNEKRSFLSTSRDSTRNK